MNRDVESLGMPPDAENCIQNKRFRVLSAKILAQDSFFFTSLS